MKNGIKTILFASLIVAMILPFSSTQIVQAEEENKTELKTLKKMKQLRAEMNSDVSTQSEDDILNSKRMNVAIKLQELKVEGKENSPKAQRLLEKMNELTTDRNITIAESVEPSIDTQSHVDVETFTTTLQIHYECGATLTGQSTGSLQLYDNFSYLYTQSHYPWGLCVSNPVGNLFENTSVQYMELISGRYLDACLVEIYDEDGSKFSYCGTLDRDEPIIFISSQGWYENGWFNLPFTTFAGYSFIMP